MPHDRQKSSKTEETLEKLDQAREAALSDLRRTFHPDYAQRTLRRLRAAAGIDEPAFPRTIPAGWTAGDLAIFHQGQRSVILKLEEDLRTATGADPAPRD